MNRFKIDLGILGIWILRLHPEVIKVVNDDWRETFYNLNTPQEIAEHIAYNLIINKWKLSSLDGWADMPDEYANIEME